VATFPWDFSLILDDYPVIDNPHVHNALAFLINRAVTDASFACGRPSLPLAGWRSRGDW
jgi:ATP/maltotriose-dependent transcriptional regulator MalT